MLSRPFVHNTATLASMMKRPNYIQSYSKQWLQSIRVIGSGLVHSRMNHSMNPPPENEPKTIAQVAISHIPKSEALTELAQLIPEKIEYSHRLSPLARQNSSDAHSDIKSDISLATLMAAGLHLGHNAKKWNKNMMPYIFGERQGIHIINLEHTLANLRRAIQVTKEVAFRGGNILFVGTKPGIHRITVEAARNAGHAYYVIDWVGGIITNKERVLRRSVGYDPEVVSQLTKMTDLDPDTLDEDATRVKEQPYVHSPDLLILLDYPNTLWAAREANQANIPIIALCDTDCDPRLVQYPIPGNDDSKSSVELIAGVLSRASREGFELRKKLLSERQKHPKSKSKPNRKK